MKAWIRTALLAGALAAGGCLQLDTTIRLHEDGSATITERFGFSRRLLDMDAGGQPTLEPLLARAAAEARARRMGPGVELHRHEVRDGERGIRESVTVYRVADLTKIVYQSPFPAQRGNGGLAFSMEPQLGMWRHYWPGPLWITFAAVPAPDVPKDRPSPDDPNLTRSPANPLDMQIFREMVPVFGDMLDEIDIRIRFESYAPIIRTDGLVHRGQGMAWAGAGDIVDELELIHVTGRSMDQYGYPILRNEEILRELLLGQWDGPFLTDHLRGMTDNPALPTLYRSGRGRAAIPPSRALFQHYYEGKDIDWSAVRHREVGARGKKKADFKDVGGWDGKPDQAAATETPDRCPDNCPWCKDP